MPQHFDVVVMGIGPGGEVAASRLQEAGRSVSVVERRLVEMADHLMPGEDPKVGAIIQTARDTLAPSNDPPCSRGSAPS